MIRRTTPRYPGRIGRFAEDRRGAVAIEYGLLLAMIVVALVGLASLGSAVRTTLYEDISTSFNRGEDEG
ncbi:Flp family type IVb pilin [Mongoliimonas terrestris]|uniref:Flp family type IVb pilin n=1 Tax=Mongoliimonas terrestris TaxID=1709001 RepID=UPI000949562F|nr:Flp family type IVb pilin [Mongoliimonas terrestris]